MGIFLIDNAISHKITFANIIQLKYLLQQSLLCHVTQEDKLFEVNANRILPKTYLQAHSDIQSSLDKVIS